MIDFALTLPGDLMLDENQDIIACEGELLRRQMAFCRIYSVSRDWYYDHIGADLEEMIGKPLNDANIKKLEGKIRTSLCFDNYFTNDNIYIDTSIKNHSYVKILVYIKTLNNKGSFCIDVSLDLVKGVNVRIGE